MATQTPEKGAFSFEAPIDNLKLDASGDPQRKGTWTMRGHAAVFNRLSHDLGGFRVKIAPGFFSNILDSNPDVHLNREHDMRMVLARTLNNSLELREDPYGLHTWARFARTPLADETATLMQEGVVTQMSFACDIGADEWNVDEEGNVTRVLMDCAGLYDVAICAQGAFPQTDASLVASLKDGAEAFERAQQEGRVVLPSHTIRVTPEMKAALETPGMRVFLVDEKDLHAPAEEEAEVVELAAFKKAAAQRYNQATRPERAKFADDEIAGVGILGQILALLAEYAETDDDIPPDPEDDAALRNIAEQVNALIASELAEPADDEEAA